LTAITNGQLKVGKLNFFVEKNQIKTRCYLKY